MTKALGSTDRVAGQLPASDHSVDGHFGHLEHSCQLTHGVKLCLVETGGFSFHSSYPSIDLFLAQRSTVELCPNIWMFCVFHPQNLLLSIVYLISFRAKRHTFFSQFDDMFAS
jgi:hypothetical protein